MRRLGVGVLCASLLSPVCANEEELKKYIEIFDIPQARQILVDTLEKCGISSDKTSGIANCSSSVSGNNYSFSCEGGEKKMEYWQKEGKVIFFGDEKKSCDI